MARARFAPGKSARYMSMPRKADPTGLFSWIGVEGAKSEREIELPLLAIEIHPVANPVGHFLAPGPRDPAGALSIHVTYFRDGKVTVLPADPANWDTAAGAGNDGERLFFGTLSRRQFPTQGINDPTRQLGVERSHADDVEGGALRTPIHPEPPNWSLATGALPCRLLQKDEDYGSIACSLSTHYAHRTCAPATRHSEMSLAILYQSDKDKLFATIREAGSECPECKLLGQPLSWQQIGRPRATVQSPFANLLSPPCSAVFLGHLREPDASDAGGWKLTETEILKNSR